MGRNKIQTRSTQILVYLNKNYSTTTVCLILEQLLSPFKSVASSSLWSQGEELFPPPLPSSSPRKRKHFLLILEVCVCWWTVGWPLQMANSVRQNLSQLSTKPPPNCTLRTTCFFSGVVSQYLCKSLSLVPKLDKWKQMAYHGAVCLLLTGCIIR